MLLHITARVMADIIPLSHRRPWTDYAIDRRLLRPNQWSVVKIESIPNASAKCQRFYPYRYRASTRTATVSTRTVTELLPVPLQSFYPYRYRASTRTATELLPVPLQRQLWHCSLCGDWWVQLSREVAVTIKNPSRYYYTPMTSLSHWLADFIRVLTWYIESPFFTRPSSICPGICGSYQR